MEVHYNRYCQKCTGKVVMHAFSEGKCLICDRTISTSHTPCDKLCGNCSNEKDLCMSCGDKLKAHCVEMTDSDINEISKGYFNTNFTSTADEWAEQMQNYIEQVNEDKQNLEALILSWRIKLKDKCQEIANSLEQYSAWHEHDDEEFSIIKEACFAPLKEFDAHFNITEQKQGSVT